MPSGKQLNDIEKGQIQAYKESNRSNRWIAQRIRRSPRVVNRFLRNMSGYGKNNKRAGPVKLNDRTKRRIHAAVKDSTVGSRKVKNDLELNVSHVTVWRAIRQSPHLLWKKMKKCPRLTAHHKTARVDWARQMIQERTDWDLVNIGF